MKSSRRQRRKRSRGTALLEPIAPTPDVREPSPFRLRPSSLPSWWRPILCTLLVLAGLGTAVLTVMAGRSGIRELTTAGAIASLIFVLLIMLLVVPVFAHRVAVSSRYSSAMRRSEEAEAVLNEILKTISVPL